MIEMQSETKTQIQNRLKRIAGQVGGLQRMVDEDKYCVDILTQVASVRSALDAMGVALLTDHLQHCVVGQNADTQHANAQKLSSEELLEEVRVTLSRFLK